MELYLQHGKAGEPMRTEKVAHRIDLLDWQKRGLSYTASGYGSKIPTRYKVQWRGRWYRVYCRCYSNIGTCYIVSNGQEIIITEG